MSDYTSWHAGMKVVCVDAGGSKVLQRGCVYTIRQIVPPGPTEWRGVVAIRIGILLVEVEPDKSHDAFSAFRFRPVQARKTSIAIFERIRDNPKAPIIEPSPKQRERVS